MGRSRRSRSKYRHYGSIEILAREKLYPALELLARLPQEGKHAALDGRRIEINNLRMQCFRTHGLTCVNCALEGTFFALENIRSKNYRGWAVNLYGRREDGEEIVFTKDHIKPLSRRGPDSLENLQTMCWPCNQTKGSDWESGSRTS